MFLLLFGQFSLTEQRALPHVAEDQITLKWNKSHAKETSDQAYTALRWTFSYLGARLPRETQQTAILFKSKKFSIDINLLGLDEVSVLALKELHSKIKLTEEYKKHGAIDFGRYIVLLLGDSENYYKIVDMPETVVEFVYHYKVLKKIGYVNNSLISNGHRIISFSDQLQHKQLFISSEFDTFQQQVVEYETMDLLPNGQWRFGIFDSNGNRISAASSKHSDAGKPAKCIWCHESKIQPLYSEQIDRTMYLTYNQLNGALIRYDSLDLVYKMSLQDGVDFSKTKEHTLVEISYISFMEPSAERLSREWNLPVRRIKKMLANYQTHIHEEFPFLGNLYHRSEIDIYAPNKGLVVPQSVREESIIEKRK